MLTYGGSEETSGHRPGVVIGCGCLRGLGRGQLQPRQHLRQDVFHPICEDERHFLTNLIRQIAQILLIAPRRDHSFDSRAPGRQDFFFQSTNSRPNTRPVSVTSPVIAGIAARRNSLNRLTPAPWSSSTPADMRTILRNRSRRNVNVQA